MTPWRKPHRVTFRLATDPADAPDREEEFNVNSREQARIAVRKRYGGNSVVILKVERVKE